MGDFAVQADGFDCAVAGQHDRAAWCLVGTSGLHADKPVLDHVEATDAVDTAQTVELGQHRRW